MSRVTLRTVSPGISTQRLRMDIIVFDLEVSLISMLPVFSTERPTIHFEISLTLVSAAGTSDTTYPSRITTTLSQTDRIS